MEKIDTTKEVLASNRPISANKFFSALDECGYTFPISSTRNPAAKLWLDRGMQLAYGFNHEQAIAAFEMALLADPQCLMAHWGLAYCNGVNYNMFILDSNTMMRCEKHVAATVALLQDTAFHATPLERSLCNAIALRSLGNAYPGKDLDASQALIETSNLKYAERMRELYEECKLNAHLAPGTLMADVATLAVEAIMQVRPWKMWPRDAKGGHCTPLADTLYAQEVLEANFAKYSPHPGLAHFYVHLMELAPINLVRKASTQADLLRHLYPCCGHLTHMPSHIDVQIGNYAAAIECNRMAIKQDEEVETLTAVGRSTFYHGYRLHNHHMLVYSAMLAGQFQPAFSYAEAANNITPVDFFELYIDYLEPQMADVWHVLIRFGHWQELVERAIDFDTSKCLVTYATALYAKALALTALGRLEDAEIMQQRFEEARNNVPHTRVAHLVPSHRSLEVASAMLRGEFLYRKAVISMPVSREDWLPEHLQNMYHAFDALYEAASLEKQLPYDEPPGWMQPVRHAIGALALEQAQQLEGLSVMKHDLALLMQRAEDAYRQDLEVNINNIWALLGLNNVLMARQSQDPAMVATLACDIQDVAERLRVARMSADDQTAAMQHSCFCAGQLSSAACCCGP